MTGFNIVVPMAGEGSRFAQRGYSFPKPLIQMPDGNPMIKMVIDCLGFRGVNWHFIARKEHNSRYKLDSIIPRMVERWSPTSVNVHTLEETTEGAACTVLTLRDFIDNDEPLLIANSDQYFEWQSRRFLETLRRRRPHGAILVFRSFHPKWSFAKVDNFSGDILEVAEKDPISNNATVGVYYWQQGKFFVGSADEMIAADERVNGEFYVAPTYNRMIQKGYSIIPYAVTQMQGVGTPEDLQKFETKWYVKEALQEYYDKEKEDRQEEAS